MEWKWKRTVFESMTNDFFVCPVAVKGPAIDSRYAPASHEGLGNLPGRIIGVPRRSRWCGRKTVHSRLRETYRWIGQRAFGEAITRSGRADGTGISCGDVCA